MTAVDADRAQVYAAELAAFDGTDLEEVVGVESVAAAIGEVVASSWWPRPAVSVAAARRDARSSVTRCTGIVGDASEIRIAGPQATLATAAHELAHALAGVAHGHDAVFRRAHLDVIAAITDRDRVDGRGDLHVVQLMHAYAAAELPVATRRWTEPPTTGGPIAL
ncbi:hypothetical protein [Ilumatobacter sp.]|uniref:hypothetical protein n=1 Tax=Ilumatobacter sp. TaxID=1967498 RepID=UPI003B52D390